MGQESDLYSQQIAVAKAAVAPPNAKTNVSGVIQFGQARVNGILFRGTIEGPQIGTQPLSIRGDGGFRVSGLVPGEYILKVSGLFNSRTVQAEKTITIPATPPPETDVGVVSVDYPEKKEPRRQRCDAFFPARARNTSTSASEWVWDEC